MVICNTSPLIALALLDKLHLLEKLYIDWFVPPRVAAEATRDNKPFSKTLMKSLADHVLEIQNIALVEELFAYLDRGEAEVVALATEKAADAVIIDDRKGRIIARCRGHKVIGTIGVLLGAKKVGLISEIKPLLHELIARDIRVSKPLTQQALKMAEED